MTTTPPNSGPTAPIPKETPLKTNKTHDVGYRFGGLGKARVAVLEELGTVPVVDLEWFLLNVLPTGFTGSKMKNDWDLDDVLEQLISSGARGNACWSTFPANPGASDIGEDRTFQGFQKVVDEITNVIGRPKTGSPSSSSSGEPSSRASRFISQPNKAPVSVRDNKSRPDGYFMLVNINAKESDWWSIICPAEFKTSIGNASTKDNVSKIIWSMHHIMREDACRRFTFGITIEDTRTCFWFASRSVILVTKPFNFITEPKPLIQMVNFLTYASEEQLGYDTTMCRIPNSIGQLIIDIGGQKFRTHEVLADFAADSLLGRGTRVWRLLGEGDVWKTLRSEYGKLGDSARYNFDDYFLTVIMHETILAGEAEDRTKAMINDKEPPTNHRRLNLTDHISESDRRQQSHLSARAASSGLGPSPQEVMRVIDCNIKWRRHYRIMFNEVATPLYDVASLGDYIRALRDAMIGIEILHKLGYVHRDISSGNVLFYKGRGRLSDLEYCKPFSAEGGEHDVRTGTCHFMSVEVASGQRLFMPLGGYRGPGYEQLPEFQFFILHDVESVWWLLTFALFVHGVKGVPPNTDRENCQVTNTDKLFPITLSSSDRLLSFTTLPRFIAMKDSLPSILHPLFDVAKRLHYQLVDGYIAAERTRTLDQVDVPPILSYFQAELNEVITLFANINLTPAPKFSHKRPAELEVAEEAVGEGGTRKMLRHV